MEPLVIFQVALVVLVGYFIGAVPTAYVIGKLRGVNIFEVGSGNMGATNAGRVLGFWWGILVWALDAFKGILAMGISTYILTSNTYAAVAIAAIAAIIGHNWSIFVKFITGDIKGGKGAATWFGTMLVMTPLPVIVGMAVVGISIIVLTRFVSLAVILMSTVCTIWVVALLPGEMMSTEYRIYFVVVLGMILYRFRENIQRLLEGTERRLGDPA
jgi:acyl phosphate:glycerol-3-phosphate acyltransferase